MLDTGFFSKSTFFIRHPETRIQHLRVTGTKVSYENAASILTSLSIKTDRVTTDQSDGIGKMKKKKILIVDDELDMRIFLSTLLETSGYKPVMTRDGKEGLMKAIEISPDLIILDIMMPGEGGVHMYRQLKTDTTLKEIPVIMLSAVALKTFNHYIKMLNARLDNAIPAPAAYMEKPPEAQVLLRIIEDQFFARH